MNLMAKTITGRLRDLVILMQQKQEPDNVVLLTITGGRPAAELYILNRKTGEMNTIKTWATVLEMNRWAMNDLSKTMAEFI